jgi:hypothetical protein
VRVDEKSQIQALYRTQPGLPLKKGRAATMTHDYNRHGVTTLYAAMAVKSGLVIGNHQPRHRAREFIAFLPRIERIVQKHLDLHAVFNNSWTTAAASWSLVWFRVAKCKFVRNRDQHDPANLRETDRRSDWRTCDQ